MLTVLVPGQKSMLSSEGVNNLSESGGVLDSWPVIDAILDQALDLDPAHREDWVLAQLKHDPQALEHALQLLRALEQSPEFLEATADLHPSPVAADTTGGRLGVWQIEGVLGQGGMGIVHAVTRVEGGFEQRGALKRILADGPIDAIRFATERQLLAELDHPGIARLLDGGVDQDGRPWMVMERIDGVPIDRWCRDQSLPLARRIALVIDLAEAVSAAHRMLVLHRDLKPGNVLVGKDGRPRVIDFGIAKRLNLSNRTEGALPLSAPYAAPELLTGTPPGPPVDVYGVAAVLYELACGVPPINLDGLPIALAVGRIVDQPPERLMARRAQVTLLSQASTALVEDLDAILARALRKEPADRYPSLDAFAEDLRRALDGRAVNARSGDKAYRLRRAVWRARWPIAASLALIVALSGGLIATLVQMREAEAARDRALAEEERGEAVRQSLYLVLAESADTAGADATSREVLDRATARITANFARDPAESARVLHALGELYFYLGDYEAAQTALQPLLSAPAAKIPAETLAAARYDMAQVRVRVGKTDEARALLGQAQDYWRQDPAKWSARLLDSRVVEAQLVRATDPAAAIALLRDALVQHNAMHGSDNRQAGVFHNNLGVTLQVSGDLEGAAEAFRKAQQVWQRTGLVETPDALNTANNLAAIETLSGRPDAAEPLFAQAVRVRRKLFGASGGTAALLSNHGKVLLQLGRVDQALAALTESAAMAETYTGTGSMGHVAALSGLADAQLAKPLPEALGTARRAVAAAAGGKTPPPAKAMALLSLARAEKAFGSRAAAVEALAQADAVIAVLGPAGARIAAAAKQVRSSL